MILALAGLFIIGGALMVVHPTEMTVFHQTGRSGMRFSLEHVSKGETRATGVLGIIFGSGLVWMVFYGRSK
jgi:hypothetical protein